MKLLGFLVVAALLFGAVISWPALKSDLDYYNAKRHYSKLRLGQTKAQVQATFGRPPFTLDSDACWTDHEERWPGGARVYTLCFDHGKLVSKSVEID